MRAAEFAERAGIAAFPSVDRRRYLALVDSGSCLKREVQSQCTQLRVDGDHFAASIAPIEQRPFRDGPPGHLFETQGLGAELDLVGAMRLRAPALVFDGV